MDKMKLAQDLEMEEQEYLEIMDVFVSKSASDLSLLKSAVEEDNSEAIIKAAHSIKGSAINLGFMSIYEVAKTLEVKAKKNDFKYAAEGVKKIQERLIEITQFLKK